MSSGFGFVVRRGFLGSFMGGINHCILHCQIRGLMITGKYGAVIGKKAHSMEINIGHIQNMRFSTNHSAVFPLDDQTTEFRQTTL